MRVPRKVATWLSRLAELDQGSNSMHRSLFLASRLLIQKQPLWLFTAISQMQLTWHKILTPKAHLQTGTPSDWHSRYPFDLYALQYGRVVVHYKRSSLVSTCLHCITG